MDDIQWRLCFRTSLYSYNIYVFVPDIGNLLTAKHVINAYLSKNNNKEHGSIYFVKIFVEYSMLHSTEYFFKNLSYSLFIFQAHPNPVS